MAEPNWSNQTIWTGDNLDIMRGMNSACVDLIYLDPPFNSNHNYAAPIGSEAAGAEFKDTWGLNDIKLSWCAYIKQEHPVLHDYLKSVRSLHSPSMMSYLIYMAPRLMEMKRLLKETGSIYLHCDPNASHYLKLLMDTIFGRKQFQSEITWQRTSSHNDRVFGNVRDTILFYGTPPIDAFDNRLPLDPEYVRKHYRHEDEQGVWRVHDLTGALTSTGESGQSWRGFDPAAYGGRHWSVPKTGEYAKYIDEVLAPGYLQVEGIHARLDFLDKYDLILWPKKENGFPSIKRYLIPNQGRKPTNLFTDIPPLNKSDKERVGYPTQKPLKLLRRVISASSNEDDVVLDPFCGCATTCIAAEDLKRQWVGIDISLLASKLVKSRMQKELNLQTYKTVHRDDIPIRTDLGSIPKYNSQENRERLYGKQGGHCNGCKEHFQLRNCTVDHIVARTKGGSDSIANLQLLCASCNSVKGNRPMEYLLSQLKEQSLL